MAALNGLWYIGVLLEVLSTMSGTVGKQLIRWGEVKKRANPRRAKMALTTGLAMNTVLGPFIDMAAYSFAPQSLIAPFGGLDVVWNAILAPYILHEKMTFLRGFGCVLILLGTTLAGCFGNHTDPEFTLDYLEDTLVNIRVFLYFCVFLAWYLLNRLFLMKFPAGSRVRGFSLGCTAGTIAGNMFCVKAAIELIQRSIHEEEGEIWLHWLPYVMLLGAVFFALSNVVYMTQGLREYEALFMVTIYEGSMIVTGCISGSIVLLDMNGVEAWRVFLYFFGVAVIMLGMYVIFTQESQSTSSLIAGKASIEIDVPVDGDVAATQASDLPRREASLSALALPSPHAKQDFSCAISPRKMPRQQSDPFSGDSPKKMQQPEEKEDKPARSQSDPARIVQASTQAGELESGPMESDAKKADYSQNGAIVESEGGSQKQVVSI